MLVFCPADSQDDPRRTSLTRRAVVLGAPPLPGDYSLVYAIEPADMPPHGSVYGHAPAFVAACRVVRMLAGDLAEVRVIYLSDQLGN